jgi:hypothetical protein
MSKLGAPLDLVIMAETVGLLWIGLIYKFDLALQ